MEKTVKINLSGNLFQIDQEAYNILRNYLAEIENRLRNSQGSKEIMDDLELRIAEIFDSMSGAAGVITKENVENMMGTIGSPSDFETGDPVQSATSSELTVTSNRRNRKSTGKIFGSFFGFIGKIFYVIFRIFAIFAGICLIMIGFPSLMAVILVLFIKNTAFLPFQFHGNFFYLPDFLGFFINPSLTPWVCILSSIVIILPLIALIYWGIRLIFWFRAHDGVFSLVAFIVWVVSISALALLLSGQGLNFSRTGRSVSSIYLEKTPATIYVVSGKKLADLKYSSDIRLPDDKYSLYANSQTHELSLKTRLRILRSEDGTARIETIKVSYGAELSDANRKAGELPSCARLSNDTLYVDEFVTLPSGHKWSADMVRTDLYLPSNTIVHFDQPAREVLCSRCSIDSDDEMPDSLGNVLRVTPEGLKSILHNRTK